MGESVAGHLLQESRRGADRGPDAALPPTFLTEADRAFNRQRSAGDHAVTRLRPSQVPARAMTPPARSAGQQLDPGTRKLMETRLGHDFSRVLVHSGPPAVQAARDIDATAFTVGHDVFWGANAPPPQSKDGWRLLAHELAHVVQQSPGPVDGPAAGAGVTVSDRDDRFECDADMAAERVISGRRPQNVISAKVPAAGRSASRPLIQRSNGSTPEVPVGHILVSPAAQEAATPLLNSMKVDPAKAASFYRGEMVTGEITTQGDATIVFFQLKESRLRAGIFSIKVPKNPGAAVRAFAGFRGNAQQLARALQVPEVELMGAAVHNKDIAAMLERQGFVKAAEPLPESLGALPGETIEVYSKRFPVTRAAAPPATMPASPEVKVPGVLSAGEATSVTGASEAASVSAAGRSAGAATSETSAVVASEATTTAESAAETAAAFGSSARAASLAGRLAVGLLEAAVLVIVTLGLEYLKRKTDEEHLRRDLEAAQPKIASSLSALMPQARLLQQTSASRTTWAVVSIELRSFVTEMASTYGPWTMIDIFQGASLLEPVTLSVQYRRDRREERGEAMRDQSEYATSTSYHLRDIVTFSIPIPYDAKTLDEAGRRARIAENEADAAIPDLPDPVLMALFDERETLLRPDR